MDRPALLTDSLRRAAERHPDRCAIKSRQEQCSYGDMWQRAASIAAYLVDGGLQPGDRVALLLESSAEYAVALYGTFLAGGVAVTLNAAAKARELSAWLGHSEAKWLVTEPERLEATRALAQLEQRPQVIQVGAAERAARLPDAHRIGDIYAGFTTLPRALPAPTLDSVACITYTSGTTGRPKGVMLTHGNLASNTAAIVKYLQLTTDDSIVTILPFFYSYGSSVLHTHLSVGASLFLEPNFIYPHVVAERLASEHATGFAGVPATFALLLNRVDLRKYDLSCLRYVTQAGGAMAPALTHRLRESLPHTRLFVMYGQTEATARLTYLAPEMLEHKLGSVGMPVQGVTIQIRDEHGDALPNNAVGEVWVSGPNIMHGYWRDEAATRDVLCDGWLRTGDMGYLDEDGYLFLAGRRSDMIKTGAHRVHPNDVEEVIQELVDVAEGAVVGVDDELLGQTIVAFVVLAEGAAADAQRVKNHCRARLASYKVPKSIEFVDSLPRTASGKVRRVELLKRKQS